MLEDYARALTYPTTHNSNTYSLYGKKKEKKTEDEWTSKEE